MNGCVEIREELLSAIDELGRLRPDWRLGQLIANLAVTAGKMDPGGVWDLEDETALEAARVLIEESQSHVSSEVVR